MSGRNRHSGERRVIKLMMPDAKGEFSDKFRRAVVETELQQKLCASEFIASVFSWGTFDGEAHRNILLIGSAYLFLRNTNCCPQAFSFGS